MDERLLQRDRGRPTPRGFILAAWIRGESDSSGDEAKDGDKSKSVEVKPTAATSGGEKGGINAISASDGWYWVIPLAGDRYSVGYVTHQTRFAERRAEHASLDDLLLSLVRESEVVSSLVESGRYQAPARVEQDYAAEGLPHAEAERKALARLCHMLLCANEFLYAG